MADSTSEKPELLYIYHVENGKIVLDRARGTDHVRHHHKGNKLFKEQWIASGYQPLTEKEKDAYSKQYGMPFDETVRPPLKEWTPPVGSSHTLRKRKAPTKA